MSPWGEGGGEGEGAAGGAEIRPGGGGGGGGPPAQTQKHMEKPLHPPLHNIGGGQKVTRDHARHVSKNKRLTNTSSVQKSNFTTQRLKHFQVTNFAANA